MSEAMISDRRASWSEVAARRGELRRRVVACGLHEPRLRENGAIVVHAQEPGYRVTGRFAAESAAVVGTYVHVPTGDVSGASAASAPL
jgi:hypothetical protein